MSQRLKMDEISAKTLPYLDQLYLNGDTEKLSEILDKTPNEALRRLTLAAVSRLKHLQPAGISNDPLVLFVEELVKMNLFNSADEIPMVLDAAGSAEKSVLFTLIIRYCAIERDR